MFTTVDKKKSRISKPPPIITDLESADVYDLNSSDDNSSTSIDDESPHWNPDESWMDDSIDRNSRFRETFSSYTQEYQSLTHDLASSAHRKIPPSTLGYEDESSVRSTPRRKNMPNHPPNYNKITAQSALPIDTSRSSISFQSKAKAFNSSSARATDLKKTCEMTDIPDSPKTIIQPPFTSQLQIHQQPIDEMTTSNMNSFSSSSSTDSHYNQDRASLLTFLRNSLAKLELDMFTLNNNITFAINSRREVSKVLFGIENESINKDSLDALAGSNRIPANRIAGLLLSHRKLSRQLKQIEKDVEVIQLGVHSGRLSPETFDTNPTIKDGDFTISRPSPVSTPLSKDSDPLMLVDASAYIFRAYYSMPPIHRSDGMPVGAVLGFCNMINNLVLDAYIKGERPRLVLVFDSKDGSNLRKTLYPQYKGNRPPCPVDLIPQFDLIKNAADAYGIIKVEAPGHEADDVIATLATMAQKEGCSVNIYSADKDLMQLITRDSSVIMVDPMKLTSISYEVVVDKWNVTPEQLGDVLALAGDSSGTCIQSSPHTSNCYCLSLTNPSIV
jgi:DNA polymerase-1